MSTVLEGLDRVGYGLKIVFVSLMISVLTVAAAMAGMAYNLPEVIAKNGVLPDGISYVITFLSVLSGAVGIVGKVYCLRAPEESRAGSWIFTALLFSAGGLMIQVGSQIPAAADIFQPIATLGGMLVILGFFSFLGFLRRISEFINAPSLSSQVGSIQTGAVIAMVLVLISSSMAMQAGGQPTPMALLFILTGGLLLLLLCLRYAILLVKLRKAIEFQVERVQEELETEEWR